MIIEKLYEVVTVDTLPRGIDIETLVSFIKETQSYEWAMMKAKSEMAETLLKQAIEASPVLYRFTKPLRILDLDLNLAYLDVTRDTSRPMMTNYHKNQVVLYKSGESYKLYLNGQPFVSLNEVESDALLAFEFRKNTLYFEGRYFAGGNDLDIILAIDELFKLVLGYTYLDKGLVLPSYQAYEAMERLRRTSYASLNKRFELTLGKADNLNTVSFFTANLLTKLSQVKTSVDTVVVLGQSDEAFSFWSEAYKKVAGEMVRLFKADDERDMVIAMSRDIEVVFLNEALLELLFMYLPNWRTKKIAYLVTDEVKNSESLWQKLAYRSEKERSMALYLKKENIEASSMIEVE